MLPGGTATVDSFGPAFDRYARRTLRPGLLPRLGARLRGRALDCALIAGTDPTSSRQLAARAGALTSRCHRARLAAGLERLAVAAGQPASRSRIAPHRQSITEQRQRLDALAQLLRGDTPLYARGVAMLEDLLSDGTGPAYAGNATAFARRLDDAEAGLNGLIYHGG